MTLIELTDKEKEIFSAFIQQREKAIMEEMESLKNLRIKLEVKSQPAQLSPAEPIKKTIPVATSVSTKIDSLGWTHLIKKELEHFTHPVQSGEIVKRLLQKPSLSGKGKRFITKAVTSKLWLLQERKEVSKTRENGRYVYSLKK